MSKKKLVLLLCIILVAASGVRVRMMHTGASPERRADRDQGDHFDYRGPIHWHSEYTRNCTGTYEEIAAVANKQQVDFMIATERNTLQALHDGKEGWYGTTLMLSSAEVSRYNLWAKNTYFLALDLKKFEREKTDSEDVMLTDFTAQNALVFRAHPRNPRWSWAGRPVDDRVHGMEIMDMTDEFNMAGIRTLVPSLYYYIFDRRVGWARLFDRPKETLQAWDEITNLRPFVGIYAPDFHQAVIIGDHKIKYPKVEEVLPVAHNHIVTTEAFTGELEKDKATVYRALARGNVYVSVDLIQDPTGFMFEAERDSGVYWMGDTVEEPLDGLKLNVRLPELYAVKNPIIHLFHNGAEIARGENVQEWTYEPTAPGTYRAEVSVEVPAFWGGGRRMGWIYSNPVYINPPKEKTDAADAPEVHGAPAPL